MAEAPEGPKNKKGRPFGSGTTNAKRRELRKEKQWSALEGQDPTSPECLMKHLQALEKAQTKCKQKLEAQIQARLDGLEEPDGLEKPGGGSSSSSGGNPGASSSSLGGNPPAKKQKSLEKDTASKMGKKGPREKPTLTSADEVEKAKAKVREVLEKTETFREVLEKTPKVMKMPKAKDLEKSSGRPLVVVDWHNTLEVNNDVPGRNAYALTMLLAKADVLILSYVATQKRHDDVLADIHGLPHWRTIKDGKLEAMVCWRKTGESGKTDIACARKAIAIFDDCKPILQEAIHWGVQPFAIQTEWQKHQWLKEPWASYSSFADAVDAFIQNNFFQ